MARRASPSPRTAARRVANLTSLCYQVHIELKQIGPRIWRRLIVPERITLARLHGVIQAAMGWQGGHLHRYWAGPLRYGEPHEDDSEPIIDERRVRLNDLVESRQRKLKYVYDFGDWWEHTVKVEDMPAGGCRWPTRLLRLPGCHPRPDHEQHIELTQWIGEAFDPTAFDIAEVNERLATFRI